MIGNFRAGGELGEKVQSHLIIYKRSISHFTLTKSDTYIQEAYDRRQAMGQTYTNSCRNLILDP